MIGARARLAATALIACAAVAGCGNGGGDKHASTATPKAAPTTASSTPTSTGSGRSAKRGLAHPIYAHCAFPTFTKPSARSFVDPRAGRTWQVSYLPLPLGPVRPGKTNTVSILEQAPTRTEHQLKQSRPIVVGGRHVKVRTITAPSQSFVATWNTGRASYVALANGRQLSVLRRFISCLP